MELSAAFAGVYLYRGNHSNRVYRRVYPEPLARPGDLGLLKRAVQYPRASVLGILRRMVRAVNLCNHSV